MKKMLFFSISLSLISFLAVFLVLQNYLLARNLQRSLQSYLTQSIAGQEIDDKLPEKILKDLTKINRKLNKIDLKRLKPLQQASSDGLIVAKKFLENDQKYLVILQNSDELRATGGFMGSFFILETRDGLLQNPQVQDIYVPDGQFQGLVEAPAGLHDYLSAGKGWRLPDANWWPNFPDSAKQILFFIEKVENQNYQGVIALNLHLIEDLLRLTGEVYLPDYQQSVNHDNFAKLARADRDEFFPGSQEKINFLNHFLTIFKIELQKVVADKPKEMLALIAEAAKRKDLQIYSRDSELTEIAKRYQIDGQMMPIERGLAYYLVESNVGINKANRLVERQVNLEIREQQELITINWQNFNPFAYVNYQRLYTNPETKLLSVKLNGKTLENFDQRLVTINNQDWLELGFLAPVLSQNQAQLEIQLASQLTMEEKKHLVLYKQSGLSAVDYQLTFAGQNQDLQLLSDLSLDLD